jgi:hypothetical protein
MVAELDEVAILCHYRCACLPGRLENRSVCRITKARLTQGVGFDFECLLNPWSQDW